MRTILLTLLLSVAARGQVLDPKMHHLRSGETLEWAEFATPPEGKAYALPFTARRNPAEWTLRLRHRDLKQIWTVRLNGKDLCRLPQDEKEMVTYWPLPPGALAEGNNDLRISAAVPRGNPAEGNSDDVLIGDVELIAAPRADVVRAATVDVTVLSDQRLPTPARLTVVDSRGALVDLGNASDAHTAVRPGVTYTADGQATLRLPAGDYTIYAGRGFEYSVDSSSLRLCALDAAKQVFHIRRVVPTDGYVACDTHVHTFTYSRHGDATLDERLITLAGEGIELPIATDHNLTIDYASAENPALRWFSPVIGEEVTTQALGHFNVFPLAKGSKLVDWRAPTWPKLGREFDDKLGDGGVVILNHARDTHGGFRPFDPTRHVSCAGEDVDGVVPPANAMEVINSGSTQTDPMPLIRDWFGMLNRGHAWTPVGASDSHDVNRYIVGQGRTYVRSDAADPAKIDAAAAAKNFRAGRVLVSYGLLADLTMAGKYAPGDLVPATALKDAAELDVTIRVLGPGWTRASDVALFVNGEEVRREPIATTAGEAAGVKWQATWSIPKPKHDVWVSAVATGPGVDAPYWPVAKPYQPTSPDWKSYVLAVTGPVRVDADGSGAYESPHDYARRVLAEAADVSETVAGLSAYDGATAIQAASLLRARSPGDFGTRATEALHGAAPHVRAAFERYLKEAALLRFTGVPPVESAK